MKEPALPNAYSLIVAGNFIPDIRYEKYRMNYNKTYIMLLLMLFFSGAAVSGVDTDRELLRERDHILEICEPILHFEEGLITGNGDLSVSIYQAQDRIIWRFGKNDVWDRRLDFTDTPKPVHIEELKHGITVEGWKTGRGEVEALRGSSNPERMREICTGSPRSYSKRPYPCPKPVGELVMQLPPDLKNMKICQRLYIEKGLITIVCSWNSGITIDIECFIPPSPNILVIHWNVTNWNDKTRLGNYRPPVWFYLRRWADPTLEEFGTRYEADYMHTGIIRMNDRNVTPLSPPEVKKFDERFLIVQEFGKDPLFEDGFRYWMVPYAPGMNLQSVDMGSLEEARIRMLPETNDTEGWLGVNVPTSSDEGGVEQEYQKVRNSLSENFPDAMTEWKTETVKAAEEFWSKSGVTIGDRLLEDLWYETLHVRRSTNRADVDPPGLFFPSTVHDYSLWHGDYHTNYNIQSPYFGDYTANHIELGESYFNAMEYFLQIGRKIARDYYDSRGVFIQLSGFPVYAEDDYYGTGVLSRMAYMTGWAMHQYWWKYLYTLDKDWLRGKGYPVIKDCALFYTDYLTKGDDGLYHGFPSNQGEDNFTGDPADVTDRPQVMQHIRYCLRAAVKASEVLDIDKDLRAQWLDRLENCAPDNYRERRPSIGFAFGEYPYIGIIPENLSDIEKRIMELNPPEFGLGRPYKLAKVKSGERSPFAEKDYNWTWYFGHYPWRLMGALRSGEFIADRDFIEFRNLIERWRHPNGLIWGMAIANYGRAGAWTETTGITGPLQEMMLQSWDGALRIFPAWPSNLPVRFRDFRAEGAFLVSAEKRDNEISYVRIHSLAGAPLQIYNPYKTGSQVQIRNLTTGKVIAERTWKKFEIVKVMTEKDHEYVFERPD